MRALWLHCSEDALAVRCGDEYLWGRDLLVAVNVLTSEFFADFAIFDLNEGLTPRMRAPKKTASAPTH